MLLPLFKTSEMVTGGGKWLYQKCRPRSEICLTSLFLGGRRGELVRFLIAVVVGSADDVI